MTTFNLGDLVFYPTSVDRLVACVIVKLSNHEILGWSLCDILTENGVVISDVWEGCLKSVSDVE